MLIETYKGVEIHHDAKTDVFLTNIVINKREGKKDERITGPRLQRVRDDIDKFLNTATKKPVTKKAWFLDKYEKKYEKCEVVLANLISGTIMIKMQDGKTKSIMTTGYDRDGHLFISCRENDAIIAKINSATVAREKAEKDLSCMRGKLITLNKSHFE